MTTTRFAGRLRPGRPAVTKDLPTSRVGLRKFPRHTLGTYRLEIDRVEGGWDHVDTFTDKRGRHE